MSESYIVRNILVASCITISSSFLKISAQPIQSREKPSDSALEIKQSDSQERWITVFVHGTCGSALSLISLSKVLLDKTDGSLYQKLQKRLRKLRSTSLYWFLSTDCGISSIDPKREDHEHHNDLAHYVIETYDAVERSLESTTSPNDFYLFGWNGMLSQTERLRESVRLYNELSELVAQYEACGVTPKIRLVCHSHGGNVGLNLGAIHSILNKKAEPPFYDELQLAPIQKIIDTLESSLHGINNQEHKWYARPKNTTLQIDELILYGTPIHQETEAFCTAPLFKRVVNLYSENDTVQPLDILTTDFRHCKQVLDDQLLGQSDERTRKISQVKIMINRDMQALASQHTQPQAATYRDRLAKTQKLVGSINLKATMRGGHAVTEYHEDLTHADFWWIAYREPQLFFSPLPFVIFTPVIMQALQSVHNNSVAPRFLDLNVTANADTASFSLYAHDDPTILITEQQCPLLPVTIVSNALQLHKKEHIKR